MKKWIGIPLVLALLLSGRGKDETHKPDDSFIVINVDNGNDNVPT